MASVLKHVGAQVPCENDDVTPLGNPDADRVTGWAAPLSSPVVIMVTPELARGSVIVPPFAIEKSNAGIRGRGAEDAVTFDALTVTLKVIALVRPPPVALMVMGKLPPGVDRDVVIVTSAEHVSQHQLRDANEAEAPAGNPLAESLTARLFPAVSVARMVWVTDDPASTARSPRLDSEKAKWLDARMISWACFLSGCLLVSVLVSRDPARRLIS